MTWALYIACGVFLVFGWVVFRGAPYVPSHRRFVKRSFDKLYKLSDKDVLVDVGSGDGVVMRIAATYGARSIGYEINPPLVWVSKFLSRGNPLITTKLADFWLTELPPETTIVYAFAVSRDIEKIATKMQHTANTVGHDIWVMTYGTDMKSHKPVRTLDAHALYLFKPLQRGEAQV